MKSITSQKQTKRARLHKRIRSRISGTAATPRLAVFRSNQFIYAQVIDDTSGKTLASASDIKATAGTKTERAQAIGKDIAAAAKKAGITKVVFDRGGFKYTGRIKMLADAAREAGLTF